MKKVNRIKNIVAAGTLTGLALAVTLAFGGQDVLGTKASSLENTPAISITEAMVDQTLTEPQLAPEQYDFLQAQNEELSKALLIMREREGQYQGLIESANQTIQQLQDEATAPPQYQGEYEEDEEEEGHSEYEAEHEEGDEDEHAEAYESEDEDDD